MSKRSRQPGQPTVESDSDPGLEEEGRHDQQPDEMLPDREQDSRQAHGANGLVEEEALSATDTHASEQLVAQDSPDTQAQPTLDLEPELEPEGQPDMVGEAEQTEQSQAEAGTPEATDLQAVGHEGEPQTAPLSRVLEREELTPLPINAVVDGRYVVQRQLHHGFDRNLYQVTARHQQRCQMCGRLSPEDAQVCERCGAPLEGHAPAEFYLMAESFRPEALIQDPGIMDLNLYHPNLVPVIDFFEYKPFGHRRFYALAEPRQGARLSQLSMPRPGAQVLNWAMQLADALDYLHSRGVIGAGADADDILVHGDKAALASLQNARAGATGEDERIQQQSLDLARLASTMYEAYTGQSATMTPDGMLPMPPGSPEQVGAAFRAAIEPVQGIAPPITVSHWRAMLAMAMEAIAELERPARPVSFVSVGLTDVGRVRDQNQDSFGLAEFVQASVERPLRIGLYVIADGLGGHKGGEIASALAVQTFCSEVLGRVVMQLVAAPGDRSPLSNEAILQVMTRATQSANERIYKARNNRQNDMGTTLVGVLIANGKAYIANVGDSRLYLYTRVAEQAEAAQSEPVDATRPLRTAPKLQTDTLEASGDVEPEADRSDYALTQISIDHSLVNRLVELGQLDPEEAKVHPHRNFIYRSLGGPPPLEVDTFVRTLRPGDRLLLCSDGLNSMVEDADIEAVLAAEPDTQIACQRLINMAKEAGGHDNITVILVDVKDYLPLPEHPEVLGRD
jgi:protein phosphatase